MRGDQPIDGEPVLGEGAEGADLILPHQAAVALHIGCEDRGELSFDLLGFQPRHLRDRVYLERMTSQKASPPLLVAAGEPSRTRTGHGVDPSHRQRRANRLWTA